MQRSIMTKRQGFSFMYPVFLVGFLFVWAHAAGFVAHGQTAGPVNPVVAVVDIPKILERASATQSIREQVAHLAADLSEREIQMKRKLRDAQIEIDRQRPVLSNEALGAKARAIEKELGQARAFIEKNIQALQAAEANAFQKVHQSIEQIVRRIAGRNGYNLVLVGQAVVIMDSAMDISEIVLNELNKATPRVDVKMPK